MFSLRLVLQNWFSKAKAQSKSKHILIGSLYTLLSLCIVLHHAITLDLIANGNDSYDTNVS